MRGYRQENLMTRVCTFIVDRRRLFFALFLGLCIFCAFSRSWVQVNDTLTDYLADETETRRGLDLMEQEFTTYGSAKIMVQNVSYPQAQALYERLEPHINRLRDKNGDKRYAEYFEWLCKKIKERHA